MLTAIGILSPVTISTHRHAGWHATGVVYLAPVTVLNVKNVKKWFHYGCTDIPAYFILHLEEIKNFHYICEECVLTAYEDALGRIAKIESSIKKQQKIETDDPNSDQPGLEENLDGNE